MDEEARDALDDYLALRISANFPSFDEYDIDLGAEDEGSDQEAGMATGICICWLHVPLLRICPRHPVSSHESLRLIVVHRLRLALNDCRNINDSPLISPSTLYSYSRRVRARGLHVAEVVQV